MEIIRVQEKLFQFIIFQCNLNVYMSTFIYVFIVIKNLQTIKIKCEQYNSNILTNYTKICEIYSITENFINKSLPYFFLVVL